MLAKLYRNGYIVYSDDYMSKTTAIRLGFKELFERKEPSDYTPETYTTVYEDTCDGIIKKYKRI